MGRRTIHKCDACGLEREDEEGGLMPGLGGLGLGGLRTDRWGHLNAGNGLGPIGAMFDLCEGCIEKVVKLLGLQVPTEQEVAARFAGSGYGTALAQIHRGRVVPGAPHMRVVGGALTKEDLEQLGIDADGVDDDDLSPGSVAPGVDLTDNTFTCPRCNQTRDCQSVNPVCLVCGYQDPNTRFRQ